MSWWNQGMFGYSSRIILKWDSCHGETGISHNVNTVNTAKGTRARNTKTRK